MDRPRAAGGRLGDPPGSSLLAVIVLYGRLVAGRAREPFRVLALVNVAVVAAGTVIHNNYVPWFSIWAAVAVAAAFAPGFATSGYGGRRLGTYTAAP